jgi:hypothetical protein
MKHSQAATQAHFLVGILNKDQALKLKVLNIELVQSKKIQMH